MIHEVENNISEVQLLNSTSEIAAPDNALLMQRGEKETRILQVWSRMILSLNAKLPRLVQRSGREKIIIRTRTRPNARFVQSLMIARTIKYHPNF
jgi:hypothetical protein